MNVRRMGTHALACLAAGICFPLVLAAQTPAATQALAQPLPAAPPLPTGSVNGHVYFAGTNAPARFAEVALQPVKIQLDDPATSANDRPGPPELSIHIYRTLLDGSFAMQKVPVGVYYLVVKYPGYLSPFSQFTAAQLAHPTPDIQQLITQSVPTVTVNANNATTIDTRLTRGASLGGSITFDDGTADAGARVTLLHRDASAKWVPVRLNGPTTTDDQGHFRITGLGAGEYLLEVELAIENSKTNSLLGGQREMFMSSIQYSLRYFYGNTPRERDAKPLKLDESQDISGLAISVPVSTMHSVAGAVIEQATGHTINKASVKIAFADDGKPLASASVDPDDTTFAFNFIPEGEYTIQVASAADVRRAAPRPPGPGEFGPPPPKDTVLRSYTPSQPQPLVVHGDMQGLNIPVTAESSSGVPGTTPIGSDGPPS